jgi:hypothetical protein
MVGKEQIRSRVDIGFAILDFGFGKSKWQKGKVQRT